MCVMQKKNRNKLYVQYKGEKKNVCFQSTIRAGTTLLLLLLLKSSQTDGAVR